LAVFAHDKGGKQQNVPLLSAHKGRIMDFDFSPFNDNLVATGAMDLEPRVWVIPKDGLTETMEESAGVLEGHEKRVGVVKFHPQAENVLLTSSADKTIKFWDLNKTKEMLSFDVGKAMPQAISWSPDGSTMAYSSKDKHIHLFDPRGNKEVAKVKGHHGTKGFRVSWFQKLNLLFSCGANRMAERTWTLRDPRKLDEPLVEEESIDVGAGIIMPFFDEDTSILYLAGKGDGNIRYYEVENKEPYLHFISAFRSSTPAKGMGMLPKYALDTTTCEVTRLLKLESNAVRPIRFCVPRKATSYQKDIYPDTYSFESGITCADWFGGKNADRKTISMNPKENPYSTVEFKESTIEKKEKQPETKLPNKVSSPKQLKAQNDQMRERITKLEKENFKLQQRIKELESEQKVEEKPVEEEKVEPVEEEKVEEEKPTEEEEQPTEEKVEEEEQPTEE